MLLEISSRTARPGRFDRRIVVPRPDVKGREGILKVPPHEVDLDAVARGTPQHPTPRSGEPGE